MEVGILKLRRWGAPVAGVLFALYWSQPYFGFLGTMSTDLWPIPAIVLLTLAIVTASRWPLLSLAFVSVLLACQLLKIISPMTSIMWQIYIGSFVALAFIMWTAKYRVQLLAGAMNLLFAAVMAFLIISRQYGVGGTWFRVADLPREALVSFWFQGLAVLIVLAAACALCGLSLRLFEERGGLARATQEARAELRRAEIDLIIQQERGRITKDLHDVLAHSLAVITAQADGTRYLHPQQPEAIKESLRAISTLAREALTEVQRVIGNDEDTHRESLRPQLTDLPSLIAQMQHAGMDLHMKEIGSPRDLTDARQEAVFRVLQESLTNALRHGSAAGSTDVLLTWTSSGLALRVASGMMPQGTPENTHVPRRRGRGIPGMRERTEKLGGWLSSDENGQEFILTAFIPFVAHTTSDDSGFGHVSARPGCDEDIPQEASEPERTSKTAAGNHND